MESPSGPDALKGTAAHFLGETCLKSGADAIDHLGKWINIDANDRACFDTIKDPSGIEINETMCEAVQLYLDTARGIMAKYPRAEMWVERKINPGRAIGRATGYSGTADCVILAGDLLIVIDYKNGRHDVDAQDNPQLMSYLIGALMSLPQSVQEKITRFVAGIVQPHGPREKIKTAKYTRSEIDKWVGRMEAAINACEDPDPAIVIGPHCQYCEAETKCPARKNQMLAVIDALPPVEEDVNAAIDQMTPDQVLWILDHGDRMVDYINKVRATATIDAQRGGVYPGFKLVEAVTRRKITDETGLIAAAADWGVDVMVTPPPKLMGLGELEKVVGKDLIKPFVTNPAGALELVPETDKRPAVINTVDAIPALDALKK